ncbi:hypothetical protein [Terrarubrum flagellatum]|uniref:hypothetical protein n=1 Tax=Terrirubrum flagellatum TaxID=2895980 RepID=UPI003144E904
MQEDERLFSRLKRAEQQVRDLASARRSRDKARIRQALALLDEMNQISVRLRSVRDGLRTQIDSVLVKMRATSAYQQAGRLGRSGR